MQFAFDKFLDLYKEFLIIYSIGKKGKGIRLVTNIEAMESNDLVTTFLDLGTEIRHVKKLASMNFVIGDKEVIATIEKMEERWLKVYYRVTNRCTSSILTIFLNNYGTGA